MSKTGKNRSKSIIAGILFFAILFLSGLINMHQYPVDYDDATEKYILWSNVVDYCLVLNIKTPSVNFPDNYPIAGIHEIADRDHGISVMYPQAFFLARYGINDYFGGLVWHLYTYIVFCVGAIFMFFLLKKIFKKDVVSYFGTAMYFLSPRLFGDSLHNDKDIPFLSLFVILIFLTFCMIEKDKIIYGIFFAFAGGMISNTKVLGIFFVGMMGIIFLSVVIAEKRMSKKYLLVSLIASIGTLIVYVLLTPATFAGGKLDVIEHVRYCLQRSANYNGWWAPQLFSGHIYDWHEEALPWYYIPKYILITMPPVVVVLFIFGLISLIVLLKTKNYKRAFFDIMILATSVVPVITAIINKSVIYNGWRHFYFLHATIMIIASEGLYIIIDYIESIKRRWKEKKKINEKTSKSINLSIALFLGLIVLFYYTGNCYYQIGSAMYFNVFAGSGVPRRYEMDYSGVTGKEVLGKWLDKEESEVVYLYLYGYDAGVINNAYKFMKQSEQNRVVLVNYEGAKEAFDKGNVVYEYFCPVYAFWFNGNRWDYVDSLENVYIYKPWGRTAGGIYKMKFDN